MSWEKDEVGVTFFCDALDCKSVLTYPVAASPSGTSFADCWRDASTRMSWRSFKRTGRPWDYFCPGCAPAAEEAQRRYNQEEQERERIKALNAR